MENFEKYLRENRDELDGMETFDHDKMWKGVEQKVYSPQSTVRSLRLKWKWLAIAASVAALIGWGLYFFAPPEEPQLELIPVADISPEMAEREADLIHIISQKEKEIGLKNLDPLVFAEVFEELAEVDESAEATRLDMANGSANERAVETLLRQYELKIRILENLKKEIEKKEYHEELEKEI